MTTNLEKWLATLETTVKAQGKEMLHYIEVEDDHTKVEKFCCLGIGCDLAGIASEDDGFTFSHDGADTMAPASFIEWLGIPVTGDLDYSNEWDVGVYVNEDTVLLDRENVEVRASSMNDAGLTFAQIAQVLRTHTIKAV